MTVASPSRSDTLGRRSTLVAAAFVFALAICWTWPAFRQLQADSYRLLYQGRWIAEHGLPYHDPFTVAASGRSFADQQWLAELSDYEAWRLGGYGGLAVLSAVAFGSAFALLAALMRRRGASFALAISCATLGLLGTFGVTFLRAQVLALPLFVALLWLCLEDSGQPRLRRRFVLVLPLLVLWANLHGSVLIGVALAGTYVCYRAVKMARRGCRRPAAVYAALGVALALTPIATPYGTHVLVYYEHMIGNPAMGIADIEWDAPAFLTFPFFQFVVPLLVALASLAVACARGHRPPWVLIGLLGLTGVAAALEMRDNIWLSIVAALMVAETASAWLPSRPANRISLAGISAAAAGLAALGVAAPLTLSSSSIQLQTPLLAIAGVASYAAAHPCARVLADNTSASALLWLDPALAGRVGFDGELEVYQPESLIQWVRFQTADGARWLSAARGYQVLLGAKAFAPRLVAHLERLPRSSFLVRDARGIAVLDGPALAARCARAPSGVRAVIEARHA